MTQNAKPVEITLHIKETLQMQQINHLESLLCDDDGIADVHVNQQRSHLMLVDYIPGVVTSRDILSYVRNHGYHASLTGG